MSKYKISIIVACYNQVEYLDDCLTSILEQTYQNWECIIVNDGSTDNTDLVAEKWLKRDCRFSYYSKGNGGTGSARNVGLDHATGDYIQFLDSDDLLHPNKLDESIGLLIENGASLQVAVTTYLTFINKVGDSVSHAYQYSKEKINFENILYNWGNKFVLPINCGLFSRQLLQDFRFPKEIRGKEDWVMWISVFNQKPEVIFIQKPYAFYRRNPKGKTKNKLRMIGYQSETTMYLENILTAEEFRKYIKHLIKFQMETIYNLKVSNNQFKKNRLVRGIIAIQNRFTNIINSLF